MDPASAATLGTILSSAVSTIKDAREIARNTSNSDLKEKIGDAFDQLIDLRAKLLEYDEEVRTLRKALTQKDSFVGPLPPHGYVFKEGENEHPLCPKCFQQRPSVTAYMSEAETWNGGLRRRCGVCEWLHYEKPMDRKLLAASKLPRYITPR